jgi:hypothetical protein
MPPQLVYANPGIRVQHGNFGYDSPMKCLLEAIREQTLPTELLDVLDQAGVKYYQGKCFSSLNFGPDYEARKTDSCN